MKVYVVTKEIVEREADRFFPDRSINFEICGVYKSLDKAIGEIEEHTEVLKMLGGYTVVDKSKNGNTIMMDISKDKDAVDYMIKIEWCEKELDTEYA